MLYETGNGEMTGWAGIIAGTVNEVYATGPILLVYTDHSGKKDHTGKKETCHQQELDGLEAAKCDGQGGMLGIGNDDDYGG